MGGCPCSLAWKGNKGTSAFEENKSLHAKKETERTVICVLLLSRL